MYTPNNLFIFQAAFAGALAGMGASNRVPTDTIPTDPVNIGLTMVAGAFAQAYDTAWGSAVPSSLDVESTEDVCQSAWWGRSPQAFISANLSPANFTQLADALIAIVDAGDEYFAAQGITPAPLPLPSSSGTVVPAGGKLDGIELFDGIMTAGSDLLLSASAPAGSLTPGKLIVVQFAGAAGAPLAAIVTTPVAGGAHLSVPASTTTKPPTVSVSNTSGIGTRTIASVTPNPVGADTIIQTTVNHGYTSGDQVLIFGTGTSVDGSEFPVNVSGANTFTVPLVANMSSVTGTAIDLNIIIDTGTPHNLLTGMYTVIAGVTGNTAANVSGIQVEVIDATTLRIPGVGNGAYTGGGTVQSRGSQFVYGTDNAIPWAASKALACSGTGPSTLYFGPGIGMTSEAFVVDINASQCGLTIQGSGYILQDSFTPTRIVAGVSHPNLLDVKALGLYMHDILWDGSNITDATAQLEYLTSDMQWDRVMLAGSKHSTGFELYITGSLEVDEIAMKRIQLFHDPRYLGGPLKSQANFRISFNSQAFNINLRDGGMFDGAYNCWLDSGGANLEHIQMFGATLGLIRYEAIQNSCFDDLYTERQSGVPFLVEGNIFAVNGIAPIVVKNCIINSNSDINTGCKQSLVLIGNRFGGFVNINPAAPPAGGQPIGIFPILDYGTQFAQPGVSFTGIGVTTLLQQLGTATWNGTTDVAHGGYLTGITTTNARSTDLVKVERDLGTATVTAGDVIAPTVIDILPAGINPNPTPIIIGGLQVIGWYDSHFVSGGGTVWTDRSGNGYNMGAVFGNPTPPYVAASNPYFDYTGSSTQSLGGPFALPVGIGQPWTLISVNRNANTGFQLIDTGNAFFGIDCDGGGGVLELHGTALLIGVGAVGADQVVKGVFNGGASKIGFNGAADAAGNVGNPGILGPALTMGNVHGVAVPGSWGGRMYEWVFLNGALDDASALQLVAYECNKWGVAFAGAATQLAYTADTYTKGLDAWVVNKFVAGMIFTLPTPKLGRRIKLQNGSGQALGAAPFTVVPANPATQQVNFTNTYDLTSNLQEAYCFDGTNWLVA
jgi:hypothetical protein